MQSDNRQDVTESERKTLARGKGLLKNIFQKKKEKKKRFQVTSHLIF